MKQYLLLFIKGMAMGAADVVPGVSGGTVAFISGIYQELLDSLRQLTPAALKVWYQQGWSAFWKQINGTFLLVLFAGVIVSLLSLAHIVTYALQNHPLLIWGFFFGLVLSSTIYIGRQLPRDNLGVWLAFILGVAIAVGISIAKPVQLPDSWWMAFLAGSIAICAMILPGVSGSFLLLLMGMYSVILKALTEVNIPILASFIVGCVFGLLLFSHFLSWLLHRFYHVTLATLTGFLLGSLNILWPWKRAVETMLDRHGKVVPLSQENLSPETYSVLVGDPLTLAVVGFIFCGFVLVLALELIGNLGKTSPQK